MDVLNQTLSPEVLCSMSTEDLKSKTRLEEEERIRQENLFKARGAQPQEAETDQFKCGKCKQRKCRYYQMQTRSADGNLSPFHLFIL
jgi:transcription elongation factor S-II